MEAGVHLRICRNHLQLSCFFVLFPPIDWQMEEEMGSTQKANRPHRETFILPQ